MSLTCDDPEETEFNFEGVRVVRPDDELPDIVPTGWLKVWSLGHDARETAIGIWIDALAYAQSVTKDDGFRRHRVVRSARDERVLVVHPSLGEHLAGMIDHLDSHTTECACLDVFGNPEAVARTSETFARQIWSRSSIGHRMSLLVMYDASPGHEELQAIAYNDDFVLLREAPDFNDWLAMEEL